MSESEEGPRPVYRAVVFDLDGTLVDSAQAIRSIAEAFLVERGCAPLSLAEARDYIGHGVVAFARRMLAARGLPSEGPDFDPLLARYRALYDAAPGADNPPFPGVEDCLAALEAADWAAGSASKKV